MISAEHALMRDSLVRIGNVWFRRARRTVLAELRLASHEAAATGAWDSSHHRERLESLLAELTLGAALANRPAALRMLAPKPSGKRSARPTLRVRLDDPSATAFRLRVAAILRTQAANRARQIAAASQAVVTSTIAKAAAEGLGSEATAEAIQRALGGNIALYRAATIARTEIGSAQNLALQESVALSGLRVVRIWAAVDDSRTRPSHADADGQRAEPGQKFVVGQSLLDHPSDPNGPPGEVINCRCVQLLEPIG